MCVSVLGIFYLYFYLFFCRLDTISKAIVLFLFVLTALGLVRIAGGCATFSAAVQTRFKRTGNIMVSENTEQHLSRWLLPCLLLSRREKKKKRIYKVKIQKLHCAACKQITGRNERARPVFCLLVFSFVLMALFLKLLTDTYKYGIGLHRPFSVYPEWRAPTDVTVFH